MFNIVLKYKEHLCLTAKHIAFFIKLIYYLLLNMIKNWSELILNTVILHNMFLLFKSLKYLKF